MGIVRGLIMQEYAVLRGVLCKFMRNVWEKGGEVSGKGAYLSKRGCEGIEKGCYRGFRL